MNAESLLTTHIKEFRRKYYVNLMIRGGIGLLLIMSSFFFVGVLGEGLLGFSSDVRTGIMVFLGLVFLGVAGYAIVWPGLQLMNIAGTLTDDQVAGIVRRHFPEIDDKLVNLLELRRQATMEESALLLGAIDRKTEELAPVPFAKAINLNVNWKYARYLGIPLLLFLLLYLINPEVMLNGTMRLVNFQDEYVPEAPFSVKIGNHPGELVEGQKYTLEAMVEGNEIPADLYLYIKKESENSYVHYPMDKVRGDQFHIDLNDIKEDFNYYVGYEGINSEVMGVDVLGRPAIRNFMVVVDYPDYTGIPSDTLAENVGDFKVLKGSQVKWLMETSGSIKEATYYGADTARFREGMAPGSFSFEKRILADEEYFVSLLSKRDIPNLDTVRYRISAMPDRFPNVFVDATQKEFEADFSLFMPLDFDISDDFGFSDLRLYYRFTKSEEDNKAGPDFRELRLKVDGSQLMQRKSLELDLMALGMVEGDEIEYFIKVWDNDYVSGPKPTTSAVFKITYPSLNEKFEEVDENQDKMEEEIRDLVEQVKDIKEGMEKFQEKLLNQKNLNYDDKQELSRMAESHEEVKEKIEKLQKEFKKNKEFLQNNQMISEKTLEKYEQLQELVDKLNDDKLNEYMEKLKEEMEKMNPEQMKEMMEEMEFKEEDLEEALERTEELLKQLEVQQKTEELMQKLENLKQKQDMLNEKLEDTKKRDEEAMKEIADKQEKLSEEMKKLQEDLKELGDMKKDTQTPDSDTMEDMQQDAKDASQEMQEAGEQIEQQDQKGGSESQKNASEKMEEMMEQMQSMMQGAQQEQDQQNLDDLRDLLENLLRLSFRQEDVRDEVKGLRGNDPMLIVKEAEQKQLLDDMFAVKDSLDELAKRVFQIEKFVTEESRNIIQNMESAMDGMDRKHVVMVTQSQHESMKSINNLANMLTEVMQQIQQQMKNQKAGMGQCSKPGGSRPNMQQLSKKQGELNNMMQQMMQNGKNGKGMDPKKLAEMAKMQEAIRQQLKEAHEGIKDGEGEQGGLGDMSKIMKDMEDTEDELKNKILTERTLKRQQQILNRLLDSFKSVREKEEFEERRESNSGKNKDRLSPDELQAEELKKQIRQELLKSNELEYSSDFINLIERYFKLLEDSDE